MAYLSNTELEHAVTLQDSYHRYIEFIHTAKEGIVSSSIEKTSEWSSKRMSLVAPCHGYPQESGHVEASSCSRSRLANDTASSLLPSQIITTHPTAS
jgi:hypothetical protein